MSKKLASCLLLIRLQGSVEDRSKVGGGGSAGVSLGHGSCREGEKMVVRGSRQFRRRLPADFCGGARPFPVPPLSLTTILNLVTFSNNFHRENLLAAL